MPKQKEPKLSACSYAWKIQDSSGKWHLCPWSRPSLGVLTKEAKPSPEAIPVRVLMRTG